MRTLILTWLLLSVADAAAVRFEPVSVTGPWDILEADRSSLPSAHRDGPAPGVGAPCESCHQHEASLGHPTGFVPRRVLPERFPLDARGYMVCTTCHGTGAMVDAAEDLTGTCDACHSRAFFTAMSDSGESLGAMAHPAALSGASESPDGLDQASVNCLSCHWSQSSGSGRPAGGQHGGSGGNHPVGIRYRDAAATGGYVQQERIPRQILLPDGKVSCVSCHRGYSARHGALVALGNGSPLCGSCHDL